jgi:hypothetical protein
VGSNRVSRVSPPIPPQLVPLVRPMISSRRRAGPSLVPRGPSAFGPVFPFVVDCSLCAGSWHSCWFRPWWCQPPWGASLHVHEYLGHDHPEHHHGPASHEHHQAIADDDHHEETEDHGLPAFQADSCDPGHHAVAVTMGCAQVSQLQIAIAELPSPTVVVPAAPVQSVVPVRDVRVHGPPFDSRIPARAPPITPQA